MRAKEGILDMQGLRKYHPYTLSETGKKAFEQKSLDGRKQCKKKMVNNEPFISHDLNR